MKCIQKDTIAAFFLLPDNKKRMRIGAFSACGGPLKRYLSHPPQCNR